VIINYEYIKNFSLEPDFTDLLNGSVYFAMNGKSSTEKLFAIRTVTASTFVHI